MSNHQEPYENITRVFWIKIEMKENQGARGQVLGEIRDVISGEKGLIRSLFDILGFIIPYIDAMGIRIHWFWRLTNIMSHFFLRGRSVRDSSKKK